MDERKGAVPVEAPPVGLWDIALTFLRIGLGSFSLAALGEAREWVTRRRRWFTDEEYLQGLGLAQLLPGAPTVNLSSYLGFRLRGLPGAAAATVFFLAPCFLLMLLLSHLYFRYGRLPVVSGLFRGLGALVVGLVFNTVFNLWRSGVRTPLHWLTALSGFALVYWFKLGIIQILLIAGGASLVLVLLAARFPAVSFLTATWRDMRRKGAFSEGHGGNNREEAAGAERGLLPWPGRDRPSENKIRLPAPPSPQTAGAGESQSLSACSRVDARLHWRKTASLGLWLVLILAAHLALIRRRPELMQMGGSFLRIGALVFGSGYAMLPFIQDVVVRRFEWLTNPQFAVALALSLITPGPVTIIGAFVGYKVAGVAGAAVGTVSMYLPSWAMTTLVAAPYARAGQAARVRQVIGGIVAAFIGTLVVVLIRLSGDMLVDLPTLAMAAAAVIAQRFVKVDTVWIVLAGALASLLIFH